MLDRSRIDRFLEAVCERLDGEWVLVGGGAAALWFKRARVTEDIDLIGLAGTAEERYRLMEFASGEGLSIEAVNSAADFFVRRIPGWREHLEVLKRGPRATIYRPDATLFILLKCGRLTEQDLDDCLELLSFVQEHALPVDVARLFSALDALPPAGDSALGVRRARLRDALAGLTQD